MPFHSSHISRSAPRRPCVAPTTTSPTHDFQVSNNLPPKEPVAPIASVSLTLADCTALKPGLSGDNGDMSTYGHVEEYWDHLIDLVVNHI